MGKIKVGSDCCGVGSLIQAVKRLGIDFEESFACDFDYYARLNYCIQYGTDKDVQIAQSKKHKFFCDEVKRIALMDASIEVCDEDKQILVDANEFAKTFSFYFPFNMYEREVPVDPIDLYMSSVPCQSFSLAGKRKGKDDKRGILFFSSLEFIRDNKPKYFIFENVKGLLSHDKTDKKAKYGKTFSEWINYLGGKSINGNATFIPYEDSVPYHIYFQVLNAKEHGVPQNRERIFIVGIRDDADNSFRFPIKEVLKLRLKDVLEPIVDEKYFLSDSMLNMLTSHADRHNKKGTGFAVDYKDENSIAVTIRANAALCPTDNILKVGFINQDTQASQVYSDNGVSPNMCAGTHGYANGYVESGSNINEDADIINPLKDKTQYGWHFEQNVYSEDSVCRTIKSSEGSGNKPKVIVDEPTIVAMRGRYNEDGVIEQNIEPNDNSTSNAITTVQKDNLVMVSSEPNPIVEYQLTGGKWDKTHEQSGRVYDKNGVAPTIHTMGGGNQEPKIAVEQNFIQGGTQEHQTKRNDGISPCLTGAMGMGGGQIPIHNYNKRIRKLTPTEVFRLMDFEESFMDNVKKYNEANPKNSLSDSQLYRQGGNSIVVACLEKIIRNLKINFE
jgi:DNA (cytosine-5)-methyltransferase 1